MAIKPLRELGVIMQLGGFYLSGWGFLRSDGNFNFYGGISI